MARDNEVTSRLVLEGDDSDLQRSLTNANKGLTGLDTGLATARTSALSLTTALGAIGIGIGTLTLFATKAVSEFIESENAMAQLEQRLKSTGGVVGLTSQELDELAKELQKVTTFGDDATIAAEALLLTFTNIRGPVFKDAIKSIQDMSIAMDQDLKSSTIQVGKALNDPIKGLTALQRVGVMFTESQKEQIKSMVESGQVAEAQGMILRELQVEFGGAATAAKDTLGGALKSLGNAFGDALEALVGAGTADGGLVGGINALTERLEQVPAVMIPFHAELVRVAMLADKAGGSLTRLGHDALNVASALALGDLTLHGKWMHERAKWLAEQNNLYLKNYKENEKLLQDLADREAGLNSGGSSPPRRTGTGGNNSNLGNLGASKSKETEKEGLTPAKLTEWMGRYWQEDGEREFLSTLAEGSALSFLNSRMSETFLSWKPKDQAFSLSGSAEGGFSQSLAESDAYRQKEEKAEFDLQMRMREMYAETATQRLSFLGQNEQALTMQYEFEKNRAQEKLQWTLEQTYIEESEKDRIRREFNVSMLQMEEEKAQRLAELWWNNSQTYINFTQQMTTMGLQMLFFEEEQKSQIGRRMLATSVRFIAQGLQQYMFGKAKEHVLNAAAAAGRTTMDTTAAVANLGILEAQSIAWAAFFSAMSLNPYGGQAFIPAAAAMTAVAGGAVPTALASVAATGATSIATELGLAAAWGAGGIAAGALGEAGASAIEGGTSGSRTPAGYGGGSPGSPIITQPVGTADQAPIQLTVVFNGNVMSQQYVDEYVVPGIKDALNRGYRLN